MNYIANTKSVLAKLLAGENISVQHKRVRSASFAVQNRVLTLPIYKDNIEPEVYDTFVAHEVGHALWTPNDKKIFADRKLFQYVNLVEDIRIERMIKNRFRGLNRSFYKGYKKLWEDNFFGVTDKEIPELGFADRLNIHAKIGKLIEFSPEEEVYVEKAKNALTFSDVVQVAKEIMEFVKDQKREEKEEFSVNCNCDPDDIENCEETSSEKSGNNVGDKESDNEEDKEFKDTDTEKGQTVGGSSSSDVSDNKSDDRVEADDITTQENFDSNTHEMIDNIVDVPTYHTIPDYNLNGIVVPIEDIKKELNQIIGNSLCKASIQHEVNTFKMESAPAVNHMVKQFEMKKAAEVSKRASTAKTGILDPVKMVNYKYSEDVFLKRTSFPEGKSHGLVMFIDWSGSMKKCLHDTLKQTLNLVYFCQKVGIHFDVYAFTDRWYSNKESGKSYPKDSLLYSTATKLYHILSSSMKTRDFNDMIVGLWYHSQGRYGNLSLGVTPLNSALLIAPKILKEFRKKTKAQAVHFVVLSDGDPSDTLEYISHSGARIYKTYNSGINSIQNSYIVDGNKNYPLVGDLSDDTRRYIHTKLVVNLLNWVRATANVTATGFFLADYTSSAWNAVRKYTFTDTPSKIDPVLKGFGKNGGATITNCGYDELHLVKTNTKSFSVNNENYFEGTTEDVTEALKEVKSAFRKIGKAKNKKRIIMNRFIDLISKPNNII